MRAPFDGDNNNNNSNDNSILVHISCMLNHLREALFASSHSQQWLPPSDAVPVQPNY